MPVRVLLWGALLLAAPFALYALHRLCLWLEARGQLYYWHKQPGGSRFSALNPLQEALDPPAKHVRLIKEHKRSHSEEEAPGGPSGDGEGHCER